MLAPSFYRKFLLSLQAAASFTQFDTAAFYLSKAVSSANYNFIIKVVDVSLSGGN